MIDVRVYSARACGYCRAAKNLLDSKGVQYREIMLDNDPELRVKIMCESGQRTVPQIWVGETHVGGFNELRQSDRDGRLDELLAAGV